MGYAVVVGSDVGCMDTVGRKVFEPNWANTELVGL